MKNLFHFSSVGTGRFLWQEMPESRQEEQKLPTSEPYVFESDNVRVAKPVIKEIEFPEFEGDDLSFEEIEKQIEEHEKKEFQEKVKKAQQELENSGITAEQKSAYGPLSDRLFNSINPASYDDLGTKIKGFLLNERQDVENVHGVASEREDSWAMYLGLPQKHNTFQISDYQPSNSKNKDQYYYKFNQEKEAALLRFYLSKEEPSEKGGKSFKERLQESISYLQQRLEKYRKRGDRKEERKTQERLDKKIDSLEKYRENGTIFLSDANITNTMGEFSMSKGKDEQGDYIAYYDKWDLSPSIPLYGKLSVEKITGKPFEIYNRIYYTPKKENIEQKTAL